MLIDSLLKSGKIKESDIILPPADEYCELLTTMISNGVLSDTRPKLVKKSGDTTFDDLTKMLRQKYLGQPVIKATKGATTEISDFIVDIIKKC